MALQRNASLYPAVPHHQDILGIPGTDVHLPVHPERPCIISSSSISGQITVIFISVIIPRRPIQFIPLGDHPFVLSICLESPDNLPPPVPLCGCAVNIIVENEQRLPCHAEQGSDGCGRVPQIDIAMGDRLRDIRRIVINPQSMFQKELLQLFVTRPILRPQRIQCRFQKRMRPPQQAHILPALKTAEHIRHLLQESGRIRQHPIDAGVVKEHLPACHPVLPGFRQSPRPGTHPDHPSARNLPSGSSGAKNLRYFSAWITM